MKDQTPSKKHAKHCHAANRPTNECVCDGYHTFNELYEHRHIIFIALCHKINDESGYGHVWRSKLHSDDTMFHGWFILGIGKEKAKQITYHIPLPKWDECDGIAEIEKAPEFDGHDSLDVIKRIKQL